jgi:hypothetical protein
MSVVATIRSPERKRSNLSRRDASGLYIVRKSIGLPEVATEQTNAADNDAGLIRLSTILAHPFVGSRPVPSARLRRRDAWRPR